MTAIFQPLNPADFQAKYPQYANISADTLQNLWVAVELNLPGFFWAYSQNTFNHYTYICLAHFCQLRLTQQPGRVTQGTQGDTSTTLENMPVGSAGSLQWWCQTNWGSEIAQLMRRKAGAVYIP